jgi:hypothetical protein
VALRPRVLIGQRNSDIGLWVSKPGKNVLTASDDECLVSPTNPNLAFLIKGQVSLPANDGANSTVLYGSTLSDEPIVWAQVIRNSETLIPALQYDTGLNEAGGAPPRWSVTPGLSSFKVTNLQAVAYTFQYIVLQYPANQ